MPKSTENGINSTYNEIVNLFNKSKIELEG